MKQHCKRKCKTDAKLCFVTFALKHNNNYNNNNNNDNNNDNDNNNNNIIIILGIKLGTSGTTV